MSALDELLDSFEFEKDSVSGDCYWMYYGDVSPEAASAELAALRAENKTMRELLGTFNALNRRLDALLGLPFISPDLSSDLTREEGGG